MRNILVLAAMSIFAFAACQDSDEYTKFKTDADVPRLTLGETKQSFDDGSVVIVDSRPAEAFKQDHISGAINIPFGSANINFDALPKGKKIVVYCS